jgi:hypothetical protein
VLELVGIEISRNPEGGAMKPGFQLAAEPGVDDNPTPGLRHIARIGSGSPFAELFCSCRRVPGAYMAVKVSHIVCR